MTPPPSYDQQLRNIGQSLEAQRINVFELKYQSKRYLVKGDPQQEVSLLAALRQWQKRLRREGMNSSLTYALQDIEQLKRKGEKPALPARSSS